MLPSRLSAEVCGTFACWRSLAVVTLQAWRICINRPRSAPTWRKGIGLRGSWQKPLPTYRRPRPSRILGRGNARQAPPPRRGVPVHDVYSHDERDCNSVCSLAVTREKQHATCETRVTTGGCDTCGKTGHRLRECLARHVEEGGSGARTRTSSAARPGGRGGQTNPPASHTVPASHGRARSSL